MKIAEAERITGGLSNPSKMPGRSYNLSAFECDMGSKLAQIDGTVCSGCYARKGRYRFPMVQDALKRRLASIGDPLWIEAMTTLILKQSPNYFRWHDSGDLQSVEHLSNIVWVAMNTPETLHWLPTKEYSIVWEYTQKQGYSFPDNLIVRVSAPFIDQLPKISAFGTFLGSMVVHEKDLPKNVHLCPANKQGNKCGDCRACWDHSISIVAYPKH